MYLEDYNKTIQNILNILSNNYSFKVTSSFGEINVGSSEDISIINQDDFNFYNKFLLSFLYLVLIILLYLFLGANKKPCSDCMEFQSFVNEFIINA